MLHWHHARVPIGGIHVATYRRQIPNLFQNLPSPPYCTVQLAVHALRQSTHKSTDYLIMSYLYLQPFILYLQSLRLLSFKKRIPSTSVTPKIVPFSHTSHHSIIFLILPALLSPTKFVLLYLISSQSPTLQLHTLPALSHLDPISSKCLQVVMNSYLQQTYS